MGDLEMKLQSSLIAPAALLALAMMLIANHSLARTTPSPFGNFLSIPALVGINIFIICDYDKAITDEDLSDFKSLYKEKAIQILRPESPSFAVSCDKRMIAPNVKGTKLTLACWASDGCHLLGQFSACVCQGGVCNSFLAECDMVTCKNKNEQVVPACDVGCPSTCDSQMGACISVLAGSRCLTERLAIKDKEIGSETCVDQDCSGDSGTFVRPATQKESR